MGIEYMKLKKKELAMTTEELSAKSGVPIGTLNKIFAGQTVDPKFETVKAICKALGVSLEELDDFENRKTSAQTPDPDTEKLLSLYNQLDAFDKGMIIGKIETLLESSKYKPRKVVFKKEQSIAG